MHTTASELIEKIHARQTRVAIIELGYVGLPLAGVFAEAGHRVIGSDLDGHKVAAVKRGESYIEDIPSATLRPLVATERLSATTDVSVRRACDAVSIWAGTDPRYWPGSSRRWITIPASSSWSTRSTLPCRATGYRRCRTCSTRR